MKFFTAVSAAVLGFSSMASGITVSYDPGYDDASRSMDVVSCSDGSNGLASRFPTQGSLPRFPLIGGYQGIAGWNSPQCGTCYGLTYNGKTIYVLAIDHTGAGFNIAQAAMNQLTNGQAAALGRIDAQYQQVAVSNCGL
ncbi:hypothetical protein COCC4DRAFT_50890 [Bipolaris maydis ATCC 48331]|uniref:Uncharacterized protein n=2 Tax=Cochliobolus heterostrophus TaxID=5016 RepID=M2UGF3_COCH5|nr:uncharacterized protein COCC4DRAFT_50890 [Bipolaris maydis ATCC 48331]EMD92796.1 hypothetical protein COCHEDRAFT_1202737 [Bipolaris maydis C5]KAH7558882.1 hypothetical protein BM1_05019 [Bipolaris maydis]ENI04816.1 hypothetical protein COCC4DRAFT_50890 [Bipolaris maydis ATCC 48331]KAJ5026117.1 Cerato-platanin [Bipolaris maydis]KAJ5042611.1 Asp f 13-like protein [Bipolaris maydis]